MQKFTLRYVWGRPWFEKLERRVFAKDVDKARDLLYADLDELAAERDGDMPIALEVEEGAW